MKTILIFFFPICLNAQFFKKQDALSGSNTSERKWWNVTQYEITIEPDYETKTIHGNNKIHFTVVDEQTKMQLDLWETMQVDSILMKDQKISFKRKKRIFWIDIPEKLDPTQPHSITIYYSGKPREAIKPPWDGGFVWGKDKKDRPWMSIACQGIGPRTWIPCKDYNGDEPENGSLFNIIIPKDMEAISNGKMISSIELKNGKKQISWEVSNPINIYNIIPYIGYYKSWEENFNGEKGKLKCTYWVLDYELESAKNQFKQVKKMLNCFENWFGPYPFYEDGYQLIQAPYLGMEHQSGIAYGNGFQNGYFGKDLSGTNWGLKWDFIIIHESGHEWFGNSISVKDIADNWIHESFTNYSETLYTECQDGKQAANEYLIGSRQNIQNDIPIIGKYGTRNKGSNDMYFKGANMIHLIRQLMNDDEKFRMMLRKINEEFYHQTITSKEVEDFLINYSGIKLNKIFDQYLRTTKIPVLEYKIKKGKLEYRWANCVSDFDLKVKLTNGEWISPITKWKIGNKIEKLIVDPNFYVKVKEIRIR